MNNQASRVAVVNQIARQLIHSGHTSEKDIKTQQDKLNNRYKWQPVFGKYYDGRVTASTGDTVLCLQVEPIP